ncbi:PD-(D/E)XK nuclease family protein [Thermogymnomonas acidicola]|uniref:PD-(D/E)XK nuclease family protein n=1 Tax=Thermogymnomonas acidicola TaxID=399579 RepID=UPI0013969644|nr:PD-(D/E)XK nuclease family protein [Thermogymnomonas acidicola]
MIEYLESMGFRQVSAEQRVLGPLEAVLGTGQGMDIEGRIDAVFSDGHNYLILDYKTDRTQERWHRHRVQLELYRDLFSMNSSVSKDRVFTGLAYVSLRGTVNTGRIWPELMVLEQDEGVKAILRRALERYLFWKEDPERLLLDIGRQRPVREGLHAALVASMQLR